MKFPAPDLVIEVVSKGTARTDRGITFTDYAANSVAEYWLVNPGKRFVDQYTLNAQTSDYILTGTVAGTDKMAAQQLVGFRVSALLLFDEAANMQAL